MFLIFINEIFNHLNPFFFLFFELFSNNIYENITRKTLSLHNHLLNFDKIKVKRQGLYLGWCRFPMEKAWIGCARGSLLLGGGISCDGDAGGRNILLRWWCSQRGCDGAAGCRLEVVGIVAPAGARKWLVVRRLENLLCGGWTRRPRRWRLPRLELVWRLVVGDGSAVKEGCSWSLVWRLQLLQGVEGCCGCSSTCSGDGCNNKTWRREVWEWWL